MRTILAKWTVLLGLALFAMSVLPQPAAAEHDDPPGRVARLGFASGSVAFQPSGTGEWIDASVNRPMTAGDKLWSDRDSRAELHLGSTVIRMGDNTGLAFLSLDDQFTQVRLSAGTIYVRVWRIDDDEDFEIDTPSVVVSITQPGVYRVHVDEDGDKTDVTVRRGHADITGGGQEFGMRRGETAVFRPADDDDVISDFVESPDPDDFEDWCRARDRRERLAESSRYVSRDVIGYEDLDDHGGWREVPDYGQVWFPHTSIVGWAPYRYGHWAWVWPWGWTWIDDEPWGFAPFHYGRWVVVRGVWGWVPPPARREDRIYVRPVYAPALVAWIPVRHTGIYLHFGSQPAMDIGWVPLAPREVYVPSYRVSQTYVNNVNITNTTVTNINVTNVYNNYTQNNTVNNITYVHQGTRDAMTGTSQTVFTSGQPVGKNMSYIPRESPRGPVETAAAPQFVPQMKSVLGAGPAATVRPPAAFQNRPVVAKTAPPEVVPFFRQQQEAQARRGGVQPLPQQRPEAQPLPQQQPRYEQPERPVMQPPVRILPRVMPRTPQDAREGRPGDVRPPATPAVTVTPVAPMPPVSPEGAGARQARPTGTPAVQPPVSPVAPVVAQPVPVRPAETPQDRPDRSERPAMPPVQTPVAPVPPPAVQSAPARPAVIPQERQDRPSVAPRVLPPTVTPRDEQNKEEMEKLRHQQDLERQRIEQEQVREQMQIQQQKANEDRQRQIQEQQQKRLEELERQHQQQEQELRKRQQEEQRAPERTEKPPKTEKEAKPEKTVKPPAPKPPAVHPQPRTKDKEKERD
ncbi:MAG: FecR domain-containing protein [Acidobacteriia bacterium]|nr:FecR domain-containing protein [Terriglobia bacterium]